jgi:UDP-N-acetyl-D-glucosamine dehydrogenase
VIIGLGYVGLPLAREATRSGLSVVGLDITPEVVEGLNSGHSHVDDLSDADIEEMLATGFRATDDPSCIGAAEAVVICVPTPLRADSTPDLGAVEAAAASVGDHLTPGSLVVLESTTYPGTTNDTVRPILERRSGLETGVDFSLAYSPERIDPGNPTYGLRNTPKVVGGFTPGCTDRAVALYERLVDTVVPTAGTREAELAKLLENTYRHVNIALMNEMAIFCHELDIDLWAAIDAAATKPFGFQAFYPGPGVGGHCIPIDPNYLGYAVRSLGHQFRFVELAREISGRMPAYVASRVQRSLNDVGKAVNGSVVLLLGVSYKANISDDRETPARPVAQRLIELGADVRYHDPFVDQFEVDGTPLKSEEDLGAAIADADLVILVQSHDSIVGSDTLERAAMILDTRGVLDGDNVERL